MNYQQNMQFRTIIIDRDTEYQRTIRIPIRNTNPNQFTQTRCPFCERYYIGTACPYADCQRIHQLYILTLSIYYERIETMDQLSEREANRIWRQSEMIAERQINFTNRLRPQY